MSMPENEDREPEDDANAETGAPTVIGTFAVARSAVERDTLNTLEVGPRWPFSS